MNTSKDQPVIESENTTPTYQPSWIDRLTDWVERLPFPTWVFYLGWGTILFIVELLIQWQAGSYPVGTVEPFHIYYTYITSYVLALMHYLDKKAAKALVEFRPALNLTPSQAGLLEYELTTLPARPTLLAGLVGMVFVVLVLLSAPISEQLQLAKFALSLPSQFFNVALFFINWYLTATVIYHIIHKLRMIARVYLHTRVDLFQLWPLYAFSDLSARAAIGLGIAIYLGGLVPGFERFPIWTVLRVGVSIIIIVIFVWPLLGIHQLLVKEKERQFGENARQLKAAFTELHRRFENRELAEVEYLTKTIEGLEIEQRILKGVSTWPWQPETPRAVIAAVILPVVVWLIQQVLQRFFDT